MFVVRDLRLIQTENGMFVSMPTRRMGDHCPNCGIKNPYTAHFCQRCGDELDENRAPRDNNDKPQLYADVCHPINQSCRDLIQSAVIQFYNDELRRSKEPGYRSRSYDTDGDEVDATHGKTRTVTTR